jgi:hypothetical protein
MKVVVDYHTIRTDRFTTAWSPRLRDDARPLPQPRSKRECFLLSVTIITHEFALAVVGPITNDQRLAKGYL